MTNAEILKQAMDAVEQAEGELEEKGEALLAESLSVARLAIQQAVDQCKNRFV